MCHSFLIHSSADGHLGCFHVLAIINSAAMNIGVDRSLSDLVSSVCMPRNGIAVTPVLIAALLLPAPLTQSSIRLRRSGYSCPCLTQEQTGLSVVVTPWLGTWVRWLKEGTKEAGGGGGGKEKWKR